MLTLNESSGEEGGLHVSLSVTGYITIQTLLFILHMRLCVCERVSRRERDRQREMRDREGEKQCLCV